MNFPVSYRSAKNQSYTKDYDGYGNRSRWCPSRRRFKTFDACDNALRAYKEQNPEDKGYYYIGTEIDDKGQTWFKAFLGQLLVRKAGIQLWDKKLKRVYENP